ncbi:hypothetical protein SAMN05414138_1017 [Rhodoplanes sp. JGI PP 4-B12]|uniref:hypothetical protein n=1 Tax=Rhodoplanes sp. JGI PP 4-B12 TaxID=1873883 RepID=UPI000B501AE4|nr:hypothetical protein [Rhodoplanes sp. JGI PP 4-B12]SNB53394.1 hypothetical protein SAMN05414138_1017 [Rhodoplanes sp. JGI PP 4-B12]
MIRNIMIALVLVLLVLAAGLSASTSAMAWGAEFAGPGPAVTGNDIGGIFPYSPDVEPIYRDIAADHCARWGRFAKVTSIHRVYGEYVGFVCYDRPGRIISQPSS